MATKPRIPQSDPAASFVNVGPSLEDLEARDAKIRERDAGYPRVELTRDAFDKKIDSQMDVADGLIDPETAHDPMRETVAPYEEPGKAYKFLSPRAIDVLGMRGYKVVKDENGDPVKMGTMILGEIPKHVADKRQRKYAADSADRVKEMSDDYSQRVNELRGQAKDMGLRVLEPGEMSGEYTDPESGRRVTIG